MRCRGNPGMAESHRWLEAQADVAQDGDAGDGNEADLVVAVVVGMAAAGVDGAVDPAALRHAGVEQVVGVHADFDFLDAESLGNLVSIAQRQVRQGVGRQRAVAVLGVVEIHAAHVTRVPLCPDAFVVEGEETVDDGIGREGEGRVVVVDDGRPVVPVLHIFVEVQEPVAAQGGVAFEREPGRDVPARHQLDAGAVGVRDVGGEGFADVTQLAGLDQLVLVAHVV